MQSNTGKAQTEQFGDTSMEIERLYVLSDFKRQGLGTLLINQAFKRARNQSLSKIWLGVWEHNEHAQRFYQAMGFKRTGEHALTLGTDVQTNWIMTQQSIDGCICTAKRHRRIGDDPTQTMSGQNPPARGKQVIHHDIIHAH